jgi:lysozyme family protein
MADFSKALVSFSAAAGGYTADSPDAEIYCGIDRRFYPGWEGWPVIDALKFAASDARELQSTLEQNRKLKEKVSELFKQMYWDRFWGDRIPDQEIATELLESAAEFGVARAVNCLQKSLNSLGSSNARLIEDGHFGPKTLSALGSYLGSGDPSFLLKTMRILQALYYIGRMKKNPGRDLHAEAWLGKLVVARQRERKKPAPPTGLRIED